MTSPSPGETELRFAFTPSPDSLAALRQRSIVARRRASMRIACGANVKPFVIVTPLGLADAAGLEGCFLSMGIRIAERIRIPDWASAATPLYLSRDENEHLLKAAIYESVWRRLPGLRPAAMRWNLDSEDQLAKLTAAKPQIRSSWPTLHMCAILPDRRYPIGLHTFHSPDLDRWMSESACLDAV